MDMAVRRPRPVAQPRAPARATVVVDPGNAPNLLPACDMVDVGSHAHGLQEWITDALHDVFKKITKLLGLRQVARNGKHVSNDFSSRLARHAFKDGG